MFSNLTCTNIFASGNGGVEGEGAGAAPSPAPPFSTALHPWWESSGNTECYDKNLSIYEYP